MQRSHWRGLFFEKAPISRRQWRSSWLPRTWSPELTIIIIVLMGQHALAHRLVGASSLALAAYVCVTAVHDLLVHEVPRVSYFGIIYATACVIVMPLLSRAKRRASRRVKSNALHAGSHQSDICAWLSAILLAGLALNAFFRWWSPIR